MPRAAPVVRAASEETDARSAVELPADLNPSRACGVDHDVRRKDRAFTDVQVPAIVTPRLPAQLQDHSGLNVNSRVQLEAVQAPLHADAAIDVHVRKTPQQSGAAGLALREVDGEPSITACCGNRGLHGAIIVECGDAQSVSCGAGMIGWGPCGSGFSEGQASKVSAKLCKLGRLMGAFRFDDGAECGQCLAEVRPLSVGVIAEALHHDGSVTCSLVGAGPNVLERAHAAARGHS